MAWDSHLSITETTSKRSSDLGSTTELLDRGGILFCHPKVDILSGLDGRSEVGQERKGEGERRGD